MNKYIPTSAEVLIIVALAAGAAVAIIRAAIPTMTVPKAKLEFQCKNGVAFVLDEDGVRPATDREVASAKC
jgi:hypothetical protein